MLNFENTFQRLIQNPQFLFTFLIGGLLCFVPVLNFFALGYLYRMTKRLRATGSLSLPEWDNLRSLFLDGIRLLIVFLIYAFLPMTLGFIIASTLFPGLNYNSPNFVLAFFRIFSLALFCSALYRFQRSQNFYALLDFKFILKMALILLQSQFIVLVACYGLFFLFLPLYGFAIFAVLLVSLIQTTGYFYQLDIKGKVWTVF